jgi:predicted dehydrogenase
VQIIVDGESSKRPVQHVRAQGPDHLLGVEHLIDCIERGERPVASVAHAVHVLDILAAAEASAREGRSVEVNSTFQHRALAAPAARV